MSKRSLSASLGVLVATSSLLLLAPMSAEQGIASELRGELRDALRRNDRASVTKLLGSDRSSLAAADETGSTALHLAALHADARMLELLLDRGAGVDARNRAGASPLHYAVDDLSKVRLLLERGADVKARTKFGNTPLLLAARHVRSAPVLRVLTEKGADVRVENSFGASAIHCASAAGDLEAVQLLLDLGANSDAGPKPGGNPIFGGGLSPLGWAAMSGDLEIARLLLERGAKVDGSAIFGTPLIIATQREHLAFVKFLLERGASVDQRSSAGRFTPLLWAAGSESGDPGLVKLLLSRGAKVNITGGESKKEFMAVPQTPLMRASRRGETAIVEALRAAGARPRPDPWSVKNPRPPRREILDGPIDPRLLARAVARALPRLEKTAIESYGEFVANGQDCMTCHNQYLPLMALGAARRAGVTGLDAVIDRVAAMVEKDNAGFADLALEPTFHPGPAQSVAYAYQSMKAARRPSSRDTDALTRFLATLQSKDGSWQSYFPRPPIQSSDIGATALGLRALQLYPLPGRKAELDERVARAREWLAASRPHSSEEVVHKLLGLTWAGDSREAVEVVARDLLSRQREDGGWSQLPKLSSDAYATGQALEALREAGFVERGDPAHERGLRFLLRTQLGDGTWFVRRRAFPFQPTMDSHFPHGRDGWISAAATSWAVLALAPVLDLEADGALGEFERARQEQAPNIAARLAPAVDRKIVFASDIRPLLERSCVDCHGSGRARGGYRVDSRESLLRGGSTGRQVVEVGNSVASPLVRYVSGLVEDVEMPPPSKRGRYPALTREQIGLLRAWIDQGAGWPEGVTLR